MSKGLRYKRILLKISGEMLQGDFGFGLDAHFIADLARDIKALVQAGVEVALVVGGGNFCRGSALSTTGVHRVTADHIGMLATMMNGLALKDALLSGGQPVLLLSALEVPGVLDRFDVGRATLALSTGHVVVLAGGTGNPFFTTDTTASLRGVELQADVLLKATKVDGVYSDDPVKNKQAKRYDHVTFDEAIARGLGVMDLSALCMCKDHDLPVVVFDLKSKNVLLRTVKGEATGTLIHSGEKK